MLVRTPDREKQRFHISIKNIFAKEALLPAVLLLLLQMAFININSFLVIFAAQRNVSGIGLFYTFYAVSMLFAPRTVGKLADRYGAVCVLPPAMLMFACAFLIISGSSSLWMFLIAAVVAADVYKRQALDVTIQAQILELMKDLQKNLNSSLLMITHNLGIIAELCQTVAVMYGGEVVEYGTVQEVFENPCHWYLSLIHI